MVRLTFVVLVAIVAAVVLLPRVGAFGDPEPAKPREIRIVAKDMTFYVDGEQTPNPTLRVKAGEQVRVVLRNEDPGMTHDFTIKALEIATKTLTAKGAEDAVVFRAPRRRGTLPYQCTPHAQMMSGTIAIE